MAELRDRYIKARTRAEKDLILKKLQHFFSLSPEEADTFFEQGIEDLYEKVGGMQVRDQLAGVLKIVPANYIAKEYLGKSGAWFSQRLNGHVLSNDCRAYFTHEEVLKIQNAIQDIGRKLADFHFSDDIINH